MSFTISVNGEQVVAAFDVTNRAVFNAVKAAVEESGEELRDVWRDLATQSSGRHGKHYPRSIDYKMVPSLSAITAEVAPDPSKPQGGMSFEDGSRNQPPHPDSVAAVTTVEPSVVKRVDRALGRGLL